MKYVSIDIETTGLDPDTCQVLEVAMVLEDTQNCIPLQELSHITVQLLHPVLKGERFALDMNRGLILNNEHNGIPPEEAWDLLCITINDWTGGGEKLIAAGKNVAGFDLQFFPQDIRRMFSHRTIDPGSVLLNWEVGPQSLGSLLGRSVRHRAYQDALDVIELLRTTYPDYGLIPLIP